MKRPFILGLNNTIPAAPFMTTKELHDRVGHNTGNLAFHHAITQQLGGDLKAVDWSATPQQIDAMGDIAVLPCANQLGSHSNLGGLGKKFAQMKSNMVAIGLGAQSGVDGRLPDVPDGTLDWLRAIIDLKGGQGPNITLRGEFTLSVLDRYGLADHAVVMGCPTLYMNPDPELGQKIAANIREPKRIAVASGHQQWKHLARLEASLANLVTATSGAYVGQSPMEMIALTRGEADLLSAEALTACRDYACPAMDLEEFARWSKIYGQVFFDIPTWMDYYRRFDFVLGLRIHGVMLALQAGVPALCIVHDSRTLELCQTMLVPYVMARDVVSGISRAALMNLFKFDAAAFDANRQKLCRRYIDFLEDNQLQPAAWLQRIADAATVAADA